MTTVSISAQITPSGCNLSSFWALMRRISFKQHILITDRNMKNFLIPLFVAAILFNARPSQAKLNVVATLPDYGAIAEAIGGDKVRITSIARGTEDPHFVDARPSFIRILNQADMLIEGGAELEVGWLPPLVNSARNAKILADAPGHVILSRGMRLLDLPNGPVDRSMGDVHPLGNPHYALY